MEQTQDGFPKARRLLKRNDFLRVQKHGAGAGSRNYVVIAMSRPSSPIAKPPIAKPPIAECQASATLSRLGLVASRRTGNAVARNRGKRVVRAWFRLTQQDLVGFDIVVILRRGAPSLGLQEASRELDNGLRRAIKKAMRTAQRQPVVTRAASAERGAR